MSPKYRADEMVFRQGLCASREQAKRLIMAGRIMVSPIAGAKSTAVDKPGHSFPAEAVFSVSEPERFVSRGGYKLLTALEHFQINPAGLICLDAGASTGGFADCLLQHGAARVYAVDVGKAQLHEKLKADDRIISIEGVNLREARPGLLPEPVDLIVADVSFISLVKILPACMVWLKQAGMIIGLIKPQFEVGPHQTRKGVVRDEALRQAAVARVLLETQSIGLANFGVVPAAIKGPKGNQEYLALWRRSSTSSAGDAPVQ